MYCTLFLEGIFLGVNILRRNGIPMLPENNITMTDIDETQVKKCLSEILYASAMAKHLLNIKTN